MKPFEKVEDLIRYLETGVTAEVIRGPLGYVCLIKGTRLFCVYNPFKLNQPRVVKRVRLVA